MQIRQVISDGKRRMIVVNHASGEDKTREAVLLIMGKDRWEYKDTKDTAKQA